MMSKSVYKKLDDYITNDDFTFDLNEQPTVQDFETVIGEKSILVAECKLNTPENFPKSRGEYYDVIDPNYDGKKVHYESLSPSWDDTTREWLYFLVYNNHIVKIGQTIQSLKDRYCSSYSAGTARNMKTGTASTTNFIISECNALAVSKGMSVQIYGLPVEKEKKIIERFGLIRECVLSVVRDKETMLIASFKNTYQHKPVLGVQEGK